MYLPRSIDAILSAWTREADRKPLVLRGARQTGKTEAVRRLAEGFDLFLELNLERFEDLSLVRSCRSADELLIALAARHNVERFPPRTLLFLDEIQESPEAVAWLRFLREDHPQLYVVAAGSLLEVRLQERGARFLSAASPSGCCGPSPTSSSSRRTGARCWRVTWPRR